MLIRSIAYFWAVVAMKRVVVVGVCGSGKTTLAGQLALRLDARHVELDALHWDADWQPAAREVFRERARQATAGESWVTDGNYSVVRDIVWGQADTLVWLDYPLWLILIRLIRRTVRRTLRREVLWNGNREERRNWFDKDSLVLWALKTHGKKHREYPTLLRSEPHQHLRVLRFHWPAETDAWLRSVSTGYDAPAVYDAAPVVGMEAPRPAPR